MLVRRTVVVSSAIDWGICFFELGESQLIDPCPMGCGCVFIWLKKMLMQDFLIDCENFT